MIEKTTCINVVFRADASIELASGHVMRCLTLAQELKSQNECINITFICRSLPTPIKKLILNNDYNLYEIAGSNTLWNQDIDIKNTRNILKTISKIDLLIVDHYFLNAIWELALKPYYKKICVIDDLANRSHHADYLLDQTYNRKAADYQKWLNPQCELLIGEKYILLRDEFKKNRASAIKKRKKTQKPNNILVSLGGVDNEKLNNKIISILSKAIEQGLPIKQVVVVISSYSENIIDIKNDAKKFKWLKCVIDSTNIASLMIDADIAIGASGSSAWERCCLGLPTLATVLAKNQELVNNNLSEYGAIINLGESKSLDSKKVILQLNNLMHEQSKYQEMSTKSFECCDGLGTKNVADRLLSQTVILVKASIKAMPLIFKWQSLAVIRKFSRNTKKISWPEHKEWFKKSLKNPDRHLYIIKQNLKTVGVLRLDKINKKPPHLAFVEGIIYEISILIAPEYQGKNLAIKALHAINEQYDNATIYAYVNKSNIASQKLFKRANYVKISSEHYIRPTYTKI